MENRKPKRMRKKMPIMEINRRRSSFESTMRNTATAIPNPRCPPHGVYLRNNKKKLLGKIAKGQKKIIYNYIIIMY